MVDLRGGHLVAEPTRLGGSDALGDGSAGEKSGGSEEGGREAEQREASLPPPHRLHRVRAWGRAGPEAGGGMCVRKRIGTRCLLEDWNYGTELPMKVRTSLEQTSMLLNFDSFERVYSLGLSFLVFKIVLGNYSELWNEL